MTGWQDDRMILFVYFTNGEVQVVVRRDVIL